MMTRKKYDALKKIQLDPEGWSAVLGVIVCDPDGWRGPAQGYGPKDWRDPIGIAEFVARCMPSTMAHEDGDSDFYDALNYKSEDELSLPSRG